MGITPLFGGLNIRNTEETVTFMLVGSNDRKKAQKSLAWFFPQRYINAVSLESDEVRLNGKVLGHSPVVDFLSRRLEQGRSYDKTWLKTALREALDTVDLSRTDSEQSLPLEGRKVSVREFFELTKERLFTALQAGRLEMREDSGTHKTVLRYNTPVLQFHKSLRV